jgi:phage FluMu gp28-like protein
MTETTEMIELSNGGRILSVPASPGTIQGFSCSVVLDEAAWMGDPDAIWQALVPSITRSTANRLSVLSTPAGNQGLFYRLWTRDAAEGWGRHKCDINDAIAAGASLDIASLRIAMADDALWRAAYMCEFIDEGLALLPYELLRSRVDDSLPYELDIPTAFRAGHLFGGFDVGRKRDLSVLCALEAREGRFVPRGFVELRGTRFVEQEALIAQAAAMPNMVRLCVDATGMGMELGERMQQRFSNVEPVTIGPAVKSAMAAAVARHFQTGEISIPDHQPLIEDLHSVLRNVTPAGNVQYSAPRSESSHADRFTALALALWAANSAGQGEPEIDAIFDPMFLADNLRGCLD